MPAFLPPPVLPSLPPRSSHRPPLCATEPKPVFYKNPSKAIEKGGGFYIPGLRGARLRYAVAATLGAGIAANLHASPTDVADQPRSLLVSAALGVGAAAAVFATAVRDDVGEADERRASAAKARDGRGVDVEAAVGGRGEAARAAAAAAAATDTATADMAWVGDVVRDMCGCETWVFAGGRECVFSSEEVIVGGAASAGAVVERVWEERRVLYVADGGELPDGIGFDFLEASGDGWAVVAVPVHGAVVAMAKKGGIGLGERRWLEAVAGRVRLGQ